MPLLAVSKSPLFCHILTGIGYLFPLWSPFWLGWLYRNIKEWAVDVCPRWAHVKINSRWDSGTKKHMLMGMEAGKWVWILGRGWPGIQGKLLSLLFELPPLSQAQLVARSAPSQATRTSSITAKGGRKRNWLTASESISLTDLFSYLCGEKMMHIEMEGLEETMFSG